MMQSQDRSLIWSEEFNSEILDSTIWNFEKGFGHNNEEQYYTSREKNIRIENGNLVIEARKEKYEKARFTSARINTIGKKLFKYGRIEVRAKLPKGKGTWPAIWMLGENRQSDGYPACGEIDIMEFVGKDPSNIHGAIHYPELDNKKMNSSSKEIQIPESIDGFHVYSIEWDENSISYFIDNELFHCFNLEEAEREGRENIFQKPFYLIINLALGGEWAGKIDKKIFPTQFLIDHIRYYKID
ncbi:MAG TPA: glycoside hydrolase family 16 protein [Gillisia sp.]|nr:glycoside hydrolase family 16 protein [Gillisia sp.]